MTVAFYHRPTLNRCRSPHMPKPAPGVFRMTINRYLRMIAGTFILLSLILAQVHSPYWLWFTAFVGLNLVQSAFTNWCPMITILRTLGVKEG